MLRAVLLISALVFALGSRALGATLDDARPGLVAMDVAPDIVARAESDAQKSAALLPALPPPLAGKIKTIHLIAEIKPWEIAPGISTQAWTYNGTVPGPTIHVRQGDRLRVILTNHLPAPTTIHWHGVELPADMDGVPGLSQSPVPSGQSYVYEFTVKESGTYLYHTHFDDLNQLDRGLYGALVVDPATPAAQAYQRDYLMLLSSWRVFSSTENYFSINGKSYPLTKPFVVKRGERVRIREINISGTEFHTMHIHGHHFSVVAVDGQPVAPQNRQMMSTVLLGPGELRDIEFRADAPAGTWMVHCHVVDHMLNGGMGPGGLIASIQYEGAPDKLTSMGDMMSVASPGGGAQSSGPPMTQPAALILGAIAGLTIFFGLPFAALRRVPPAWLSFLNATAIGVLFFLLFDILRQAGEPLSSALHLMQLGGGVTQLVVLLATYVFGLGTGLVGLVYFTRVILMRSKSLAAEGHLSPMTLATTIAVGIGLHNFGEGLAIGQSAATGAIQLAVLLIIGFGLHNMTEGFGIAAPLAGTGTPANLAAIVRLGLIGGGPTFLGTVVGYHFVSPLLSVLFLTLAAGAIIYVIGEMTKAGSRIGYKRLASVGVLAGFLLGLGTDLILSAAGA